MRPPNWFTGHRRKVQDRCADRGGAALLMRAHWSRSGEQGIAHTGFQYSERCESLAGVGANLTEKRAGAGAFMGPAGRRIRAATARMNAISASDVPIAHTPPGGWGDTMPRPILARCTEPLVSGAPDLRGLWIVVAVEVDGVPDPAHRALGHRQRVEQCGDRLVVTAGGVIHDMRCDGTVANGVHDVAEFDFSTAITVVASYEDGVHVLRPQGMPVEVTRRRDGDQMVWTYPGFTAHLERLGPPDMQPQGTCLDRGTPASPV